MGAASSRGKHVGKVLLGDTVEGMLSDCSVVVEYSILPNAFFDWEGLAERTCSGAEQEDTDQNSHVEMNLRDELVWNRIGVSATGVGGATFDYCAFLGMGDATRL